MGESSIYGWEITNEVKENFQSCNCALDLLLHVKDSHIGLTRIGSAMYH